MVLAMAMTHASPLRWLIGTELARYRNEARLSLNEAAERAGLTRAKLNHLEMGRQHQAPDDIAMVLGAYGAPARDVDRLTSLTGRADEATWWAPWAAVVPDWLKTFVGLEALADEEFTFEPTIIPGLLQTQEYAAAITANSPRVRRDHGERFVGFRMARTRRLTAPDRPLRLHAVLTEGALRLAVGDADLRRAQLRHLVELAKLPNVTLQVVRPEDGPHTALAGPFVLLYFEPARPICYVELKDGAIYLQESDQVSTYRMVAGDLQQVALGPEQSIAFIEAMMK
jgi:transcriptional regulator with XRE-family HTH domain